MHWATKYIGIPHVVGGRCAEGLDCWGLLCVVYRDRFGIELPIYAGATALSMIPMVRTVREVMAKEWKPLLLPFDGCAVALSQAKAIHHVGIYIEADGGKFLHAWDAHRVIADTRKGLSQKGFKTIKFYQYGLHH